MNLPRWWAVLLVVTLLLGALMLWLAPQNVPLLAYKLLLLCVATLAATVIDRLFFKPERKDAPYANVARALVFAAVVAGLTLGV